MDIITQGLLGATVAQACAKTKEVRLASLAGFCAPLLADADAFIRSSKDPLLFLESHRHFTHALLFIPVGALVASLLLWIGLRNRLALNRIILYALLGYATAGLLDACTSYGTHLLWPFSDERTAWSIISIFDPIFFLGLIVAIGIGVVYHQPLAARVGVLFAVVYLSVGVVQQHRAESMVYEQAQKRGHVIERLVVKPSIGNLLLWRSVYVSDRVFYIDAVRVGLVNNSKVFEGGCVQAFNLKRDLPLVTEETVLYHDIQRFKFFSEDFLVWHPEYPHVLGDVRYAMVPNSVRPLWGIRLTVDSPEEHVRFETYRTVSVDDRKAFFAMLLDQF